MTDYATSDKVSSFVRDLGLPRPCPGSTMTIKIASSIYHDCDEQVKTFKFECDMSDPLGCWKEIK